MSWTKLAVGPGYRQECLGMGFFVVGSKLAAGAGAFQKQFTLAGVLGKRGGALKFGAGFVRPRGSTAGWIYFTGDAAGPNRPRAERISSIKQPLNRNVVTIAADWTTLFLADGTLPAVRMKKPRNREDNFSGKRGRARLPREVAVLYEDDAVVAVNKPAGLPAVPVKGSDAPSAFSLLAVKLKRSRERVFVVHRIDRFASGILLFAKTEADRHALVRQFLAHTPVRRYLAVVRGHLETKEGTLVHYFRRQGMFQKLVTERTPHAARAELRYVVERRLRGASLIRVSLATGLQNQIRVQLLAVGHPVMGDRKYHPSEASEPRIQRVALHAAHLEFIHPRTGKTVSLDCEPHADFRALLRALESSAGK